MMLPFFDIGTSNIVPFILQGEHMMWLPFLLTVVFTAVASILLKLITNNLPRIKALFVLYFFCALFIFLAWLIFDRAPFSITIFLTIGIGLAFLNYIGAYCQWSAYKINMSRTSLFIPLISVLSIVLYGVFLKEYQHLSVLVVAGVVLQVFAVCLFDIGIAQSENKKAKRSSLRKWLLLTIGFIIAVVLINFWTKVASFNVPITQFLLSWYLGSLFFSFLALPLEKEKTQPVKRKLFFLVPLCSIFSVAGLFCAYWIFQLNSGTVSVSFLSLNSTFVPALIGLFIFRESRGMSKIELAGFLCAVVATIFLLYPY